jgi:hypothetical protein
MSLLKKFKWLGLDEEHKVAKAIQKQETKERKLKELIKNNTHGIIGTVELKYVELIGGDSTPHVWVKPEDAVKLIDPANYNKFVVVKEYDRTFLKAIFGPSNYEEIVPIEHRIHPDDEVTDYGFYPGHEIQINTGHVRKINTTVYKKYLYGRLLKEE